MRCSKVRKLMFKFFEEDVSEKQMVQVKEHLNNCPWCEAEYKKGMRVFDSMHRMDTKLPPDGIHKNIMQEVCGMDSFIKEERKEYRINFKRGIRKVAIACCAVFIVAFALSFVDFNMLKESSLSGINKLANSTFDKLDVKEENEALVESEESKIVDTELFASPFTRLGAKNNTKEESTLTGDLVMMASANQSILADEAEAKTETVKESEVTSEKESKKKTKLDDIILEKGFQTVENYNEYLDNDDNVTKKGLLELYTLEFDKALKNVNTIASNYGANIYYSNVYYNENGDGYRTAVTALRVLRDEYKNLKADIEKLGKYDINVTQDELKVETTMDLESLLGTLKESKAELEKQIEELDEDNSDYEVQKETLEEQLSANNESISNVEKNLENMKLNVEIINLEVTLKECSELELEGILSGKTFWNATCKNFKLGWEKFVRMLQNIFLWICENILFILFFLILFGILWAILKAFFLRDRD